MASALRYILDLERSFRMTIMVTRKYCRVVMQIQHGKEEFAVYFSKTCIVKIPHEIQPSLLRLVASIKNRRCQ